MPISGDKKLVLAPRSVLIDLLRQMEDIPEQAKTRYLLALILLRRRFVKLAKPGIVAKSEHKTAEVSDEKWMPVEVVEDGSTIEILECDIAKSEAESLSEALTELLYCEASEIEQE